MARDRRDIASKDGAAKAAAPPVAPPVDKPLAGNRHPRSITTSCSLSSGHLPAMPPAQITPPNAARLTIDLPLHTEIRP
jgi:hypothetical protein